MVSRNPNTFLSSTSRDRSRPLPRTFFVRSASSRWLVIIPPKRNRPNDLPTCIQAVFRLLHVCLSGAETTTSVAGRATINFNIFRIIKIYSPVYTRGYLRARLAGCRCPRAASTLQIILIITYLNLYARNSAATGPVGWPAGRPAGVYLCARGNECERDLLRSRCYIHTRPNLWASLYRLSRTCTCYACTKERLAGSLSLSFSPALSLESR